MTYAIIKVAGKQYRVHEGERLLVDRLAQDEGATITPTVLLVGGDGAPVLDPAVKVTATVLGAVKGPKIRIGKYKKRTGYRKHTGFRAALTQIQIESIGAKPARTAAKSKAEPSPKAERAPKEALPAASEATSGIPAGYAEMTVAEIKSNAGDWSSDELAAALAYEQEHGKRKGALTTLESARAQKEGV